MTFFENQRGSREAIYADYYHDLTHRFPIEIAYLSNALSVEAWSMVVPWIGFPLCYCAGARSPRSLPVYLVRRTRRMICRIAKDRFYWRRAEIPFYVEGATSGRKPCIR